MPPDIRDALHDAAPAPRTDVDMKSIEARAHRLRTTRLVTRASIALVTVLALGGTVLAATGQSDDVKPAVVANPPEGQGRLIRNSDNGYSVRVPLGWAQYRWGYQNDIAQIPILQLRSNDSTASVSDCASKINGIGGAQVGLRVSEERAGVPPISSAPPLDPRPPKFGPESGESGVAPVEGSAGCASEMPRGQGFRFTDRGRNFSVLLLFGPRSTAERRAEAYKILDSLRFAPASEHEPRRAGMTVRVFVDDASGMGAEEDQVRTLRMYNYILVGSRHTAPVDSRTRVRCIPGYVREGKELAANIGRGIPVASTAAMPRGAESAHCVVFLGAGSRPPAQVTVKVSAGGARADAVKATESDLRRHGYDVKRRPPAFPILPEPTRAAAECRQGFSGEATALAKIVGGAPSVSEGTDLPDGGDESVDCLVTLAAQDRSLSNARSYRDEIGGFSVRFPRSWEHSEYSLTDHYAGQLLTANRRHPVTPSCDSTRARAGAGITLSEQLVGGEEQPPRPRKFGPEFGTRFDPENSSGSPCPGEGYVVRFRDQGRVFIANLSFGPDTSPAHRAEAYRILDSLRFVPADEYEPPDITTVDVVDDNGPNRHARAPVDAADAVVQRRLEKGGIFVTSAYATGVSGQQRLPLRRLRADVACDTGDDRAREVADALGMAARVVAPEPLREIVPDRTGECIVILRPRREPRDPSRVLVQVLTVNRSGTRANELRGTLRSVGYKVAALSDTAQRDGTYVQCRAGFEQEAVRLAKQVSGFAAIEPLREPRPSGADPNADCLVILPD